MTERDKSEYVKFLEKYLESNQDALLWVQGYSLYVHAVDDIIDQEIPKEKDTRQFMLETFEFAECVYASQFYIQHIHILRPLIKMASNTYMDSVKLEFDNNPRDWKKITADHLRHTGNEVILACIEIVNGTSVRNEASIKLRELSYRLHHTPEGFPC